MNSGKELAELPPMSTEQLNKAIGEELFGVKKICDGWGRNIGTRKAPEYYCRKCGKWSELSFGKHETLEKGYSVNPQDTNLVVAWLEKELRFFRLLYSRSPKLLCDWSVNVGDFGCVDTLAYGTTWMEAICRAALVVKRTGEQ